MSRLRIPVSPSSGFVAIIMVVLLGLLVAFIVWLVGDQRRRPHHEGAMTVRPAPAAIGSASEILDRRLATGELSIDEYERLKASLATPARVPPAAEPPNAPQS
jgi:uncharacterized membrane protein